MTEHRSTTRTLNRYLFRQRIQNKLNTLIDGIGDLIDNQDFSQHGEKAENQRGSAASNFLMMCEGMKTLMDAADRNPLKKMGFECSLEHIKETRLDTLRCQLDTSEAADELFGQFETLIEEVLRHYKGPTKQR